jgi:uncharacterized protein (DUF1697 family)
MARVVFLRGVNVGGHRTFRPSVLAHQLEHYDAINIGAAGTFVIRKRVNSAELRAELQRLLPFETQAMICTEKELLSIAARDPFGNERIPTNVVRFVSVLAKSPVELPSLPLRLPPSGAWLLRVLAAEDRFVFGMYRRHMKAIGYLGKLDKLFGVPVTTRNWNTFAAIITVLKDSR